MKTKSLVLMVATVAFCQFVLTQNAQGQRLYNEDRDKKAQDVAKLAKEISSNATFEHQLKNLDTFSRRDAEVYFRGAKRQMDLEISGFRTWGRVASFVGNVQNTLQKEDFISTEEADRINDDLEHDCPRSTELGKAICNAKQELARSKEAVAASEKQGKALEKELESRLEAIGEVESLVNKAETFLKSDSKNNETIKGLTEVVINLSKSYANFTNKLSVIRNEPRDDLKFLLQRIAIEALQVEVDHWKTLGDIKLRRIQEQEDLARMAREFGNRMQKIVRFYPCLDARFQQTPLDERLAYLKEERTEVTFSKIMALSEKCEVDGKQRGKEFIADYLFQTLHLAAALAARGETPMKLAQLRLAQEHQRYSIRQSAVVARGYELVLSSGTERLARYYAGGLKPEKVAQLIYAAATVAIPGVIAGK